jgi:hypothetical protein
MLATYWKHWELPFGHTFSTGAVSRRAPLGEPVAVSEMFQFEGYWRRNGYLELEKLIWVIMLGS